jgi:hypothetical protein
MLNIDRERNNTNFDIYFLCKYSANVPFISAEERGITRARALNCARDMQLEMHEKRCIYPFVMNKLI